MTMSKTELATAITDFLSKAPNVDGEAAPGLKLLRQAAVALARKDEPVTDEASAIAIEQLQGEVRAYEEVSQSQRQLVRELDVLLNGDNAAKQASLADIVSQLRSEPAGKLLGFVNADYVSDVLHGGYDAMSVDISEEGGTTSDLAIYAQPRRIGEEFRSVDEAMQDFFAVVVQNLGGNEYTTIAQATELFRAQQDSMRMLNAGIKNRDAQIEAQDRFVTAILEAAGEDAQDADQLPALIKEAVGFYRQLQRPEGAIRVVPAGAGVEVIDGFQKWANDAIDLAHAVAGDLSPANRVMAKAARDLILMSPRGEHE